MHPLDKIREDAVQKMVEKKKPEKEQADEVDAENIEYEDEEYDMGEEEVISRLQNDVGLSPEQAKKAYDIMCEIMK